MFLRIFVFDLKARTRQTDRQTDRFTGKACDTAYYHNKPLRFNYTWLNFSDEFARDSFLSFFEVQNPEDATIFADRNFYRSVALRCRG